MNIDCLNAFWEGLKPTELLTVSAWADKYRFLSSEASAEHGSWKTSRTPYLKEIMDNLSPTSPFEKIVVQKGVQLGFTESGLNTLGCFVDIAPCPMMYVMPSLDMAKGFSETRLTPMIEASMSLSKKIRPARERDSKNTVLTKGFPGGVIVLTGSNSASSLRSRAIRVLIMDEVDAYPLSLDKEGSPISLAEKRTVTFSNKKIYMLSTPTTEEASVIAKELKNTDKRMYFVPLPCCGTYQTLEFSNLVWEKGNYKSVRYKCPHCEGLVEERFKGKFLAQGEWRSTVPEKKSSVEVGYFINGLYSPLGWLSWKTIAKDWDEIQENNDEVKLITFTNTVLGETWKTKIDSPQWENVYNKRESYELNRPSADVGFITAGVDVQKDRLVIEIKGWCKGKVSQSLDYRVLTGDVEKVAVWDKLAEILNERWITEDGRNLGLKMMAVDSGYATTHVYAFCSRFDVSRVVPIKGSDKIPFIVAAPKQVYFNQKGEKPKKGNILLWMAGVSVVKEELYALLRLQKLPEETYPAGYCRFPQYSPDYFRGLTAEIKKKVKVKGYDKFVWEKQYERNEPLDCHVYNRVAATIIGLESLKDKDWDVLLGKTQIVKKKKEPSEFWKK